MDALALGIPIICLDGDELHSTIDSQILKKIKVHECLLATDMEQWVKLTLQLVEDVAYRKIVAQRCYQGFRDYMQEAEEGETMSDVLLKKIC